MTETATVAVTVTPVNDAPVNTVPGAQVVAEDAPLAFVNGSSVRVADVDGDALTATLTVTGGTATVAAGGGATINGNGSARIVVSGSAAQVNAALAGLTYRGAPDFNGAAQLTVATSDGTATDTDTIAIQVTPVADITADTLTTREDTAVGANLILGTNGATADGFSDPGRTLTAVTQPPAGQGSVAASADGTIVYAPPPDFNGVTSFTYTVTAGGVTETATVTVTVTPVNDAPVVAIPGAQVTAEDTARVFSTAGGNALAVADIDSGVLTVSIAVTGGTFSLAGITGLTFAAGDGTADAATTFSGTAAAINAALDGASYGPNPDTNGPAQLTLQVSDGALAASGAVALTVAPVVDIADDAAVTDEDAPVAIPVFANDTFEDVGRTVTAVNGTAIAAGGPAVAVENGTVTLTPQGVLVFGPATDFNGMSTFTYTVSAGGVFETGTVRVAVAAVNTPPVNTLPTAFATREDTGLVLAGLAVADADAGTGIVRVSLSVNSGALGAASAAGVAVSGAGTGTLTLDGTIAALNAYLSGSSAPVFTPAANATASVTLTMATSDNGNTGGMALTDIDTATILITPVNDAPAGADRSITLAEDTTYTFSALDFGLTDPADDPTNALEAVIVDTLPAGGTLALGGVAVAAGQGITAANLGLLTFTPSADVSGATTFTFRVRDNGGVANGGQDTDPTPNTVTLNLTPVNDAPVNTLPASFGTAEDTPAQLTGLAIADIDAGPGAVTVTLAVDRGILAATGTAGVAVAGSGGGRLVLTGTVAAINAYLAGPAAPVFAPTPDFNGPVTLTMVTDDRGNTGAGGALIDTDTRTITVTPVNDAPVAADAAVATVEDTPLQGRLPAASDVDGDVVTYGPGSRQPASGRVDIRPDGTFLYVPEANASGLDSFTYTVDDGTVTREYTVTVSVAPVNDTPVAAPDAAATDANIPVAASLLANDADADGDPVAIVAVNGAAGQVGALVAGSAGGRFVVAADGSATFDPAGAFADLAEGQTRATSITYRIADPSGAASDASFTVTVTGRNDAPVSAPIPDQAAQDGAAVALALAGSFADPDAGDALRFTAAGLPAGLTIDSATGLVSGTLAAGASAGSPYAVTVTATDRLGLSTSRTFALAVANPAPVARDDSFATDQNTPVGGSVLADNGAGPDLDPDGDALAVAAVNGAAGLVGVPVAGSAGGRFTIAQDGSFGFEPGTDFVDLAAGETRVTQATYTLSDGQGGTATGTATVVVTGTNDAPVAQGDGIATREDQPVTVDPRLNDTDAEGAPLTVAAIDGQAIAPGLTVAVANGAVTLKGDGTLTFTPAPNANGAVSFSYTVSDGQGGSATAAVSGTITPVNDVPVPAADGFITAEDTPATLAVLTNDIDVDADPLTITAIDGRAITAGTTVAVAGGAITLNPDGTLGFVPRPDFNGPVSFTYTVSDGQGGSATATVSGVVTPVQDPPVALADSFTGTEDTPALIAVLANDRDADGDPLTIAAIDGTGIVPGGTVAVAGGAVTLNPDGTLAFVPAQNLNGPVSFTYTVSDGRGGVATATVTGALAPINDAPVLGDDSFSVPEDGAVTFDVRGNDSDVDGDTLGLIQINGAFIAPGGTIVVAGGAVTLNADGTLTFVPLPDFNGPVSFTYSLSDGNGGSDSATVSGLVTPVEDAPTVLPDSFAGTEDTPVTIAVLGNDGDRDGDPLTITAIDGTGIVPGDTVAVAAGRVTLNPDGTLTFVPITDVNGPVSFTYTVSDGQGGTASAAVTGVLAPVNDPPVAADAAYATGEDTALTAALPAAFDADGDTVTYAPGSTTPASGTVTINPNGTFTYQPAPDFNGTDRFSYVVSDGRGGLAEYDVVVAVAPANDAPAATTPLPDRMRTDGQAVSFDAAAYFADIDGDRLTFTATGLPPGLTISPDGVVSGTIDRDASQRGPNGNGTYTVVVTASDGQGGTASDSYAVVVANPAPVARNDTAVTLEDIPVTLNVLDGSASGGVPDADPDGDPLRVIAASAGHGTVTLGQDGAITYAPAPNFNGVDTIVYTISDGNGGTASAAVSVTVAAVNDAPVTAPIADRIRNDGDVDAIDAGAFFSDPEGEALIFAATGLPPGLGLDPVTGRITGRLAADASGPTGTLTYPVTVSARDASGATSSVSFAYTVLNLPPQARDDVATTAEDTPVIIPILSNDTDPDGDSERLIAVNNVVLVLNGPAVATANGSVQLILDGAETEVLRFTPNPDFTGQESFTYTIIDGNGGRDTATALVTVTPVNDAPRIVTPVPDRVRADGQTFTYDLADFFRDPDGDRLAFAATGLPQGLAIDPVTGFLSGTIAGGASQVGGGIYAVTVTATDPGGQSLSQAFTLTVTNPAPVALDDAATTPEDVPVRIAVLANDVDADADPLAIVAASAGAGSVAIDGGALVYTPAPDFNGTDTIVYTIADGNGGFASASVRVTVLAANDAPVSAPIANRIDTDGQALVLGEAQDFSVYFSDPEGGALTFAATGLPQGLIIDPATGLVSGTIAGNASTVGGGVYGVTITASDGTLSTSRAFTWFIANIPPKGFSDTVSAPAGAASGDVLANDQDDDGDPLTVTGVDGVAVAPGVPATVRGSAGGSFTLAADGAFTFTAGPDFADLRAGETRATSVVYALQDTDGGADTATLTVVVTGANDAPAAATIPAVIRADGDGLGPQGLVLAPFFDDAEGDTLAFTATGLPPGLAIDPVTGSVTGTIARDASQGGPAGDGVYTVTVTASDGASTTATSFAFTVTNPAPVGVNDAVTIPEDTSVDIDVVGNDVDPDGDALFVDPAFAPVAANGTVAINPDGTLRYTPNVDYSGVDTVVYRVSDGQGGLSTAIVNVSVNAVNDAPVATAPIADAVRNDGDTLTIDVSGDFRDPEGERLTFFATGLPPGLGITAGGVISGTIAPGASGPTGTRDYLITVTAEDSQGARASSQFTYTVNNLTPQAQNDTVINAVEDVPVLVDVLGNDVDPDGDTNVVIRVENVALVVGGPAVPTSNGIVQLVAGGAGRPVLLFTPNPDFNGTESFTYTIDDGNAGTDTATVAIVVAPVNDAPVAGTIPDRVRADGEAVDFDVSDFFSDADGDALAFTAAGLPPGLTISPAGVISGTLDASASRGGAYTVTVTASDGGAAPAQASFTFTVTNPVPVAVNDTVTTTEDVPVTFDPISGLGTTSGPAGADADPDGDALRIAMVEGRPIAPGGTVAVADGTVTLNADGTLTFAPAANFNGTTVITYGIVDADGAMADAAVSLTVVAVDDAPAIDLDPAKPGPDSAVVFVEGGGPVAVAPGVSLADAEDDAVGVRVVFGGEPADAASEILHLNGAVDIRRDAAASGTIAFGGSLLAYAYDGNGALTVVNAAGAGTPLPAGTLRSLVAAIRYENVSDAPTPGARTLTFTVVDTAGNVSQAAVATVAVVPVNTAPGAADDAAATGEDAPILGGASVLANDRDPEGDALTVVAVAGLPAGVGTAVAGSAGGTFTIRPDGTYDFDPGAAFQDLQQGESRATRVTYTAADPSGATATATLTVTVAGANDAPVAADLAVATAEDGALVGALPGATDADGDALVYAEGAQAANGTVAVSADGTFTYTPDPDFTGTDRFTYTLSDGRSTVTYAVTVAVAPVNDAPVAAPIPDRAFADGEPVRLDVSGFFTDIDGDALLFAAAGLPAGLAIDPATGVIAGTVDAAASQTNGGVYAVAVTVRDPSGTTATQALVLRIANPAPVAEADAVATVQGVPVSGSVLADNGAGPDRDPDGDSLSVVAVGGAGAGIGAPRAGSAGGLFTIRADGTFDFAPGSDFDDLPAGITRTSSIAYTVSDGQGGTATAVLTVTVAGANDAPVGSDATLAAIEDTPASGRLPTAADLDGDALTYALATPPTNGTVAIDPTGTFTYTPAPNYSGPDGFTYTISDGTTAVTYTVTVAVAAVNDAPAAAADAFVTPEDVPVTIRVLANDTDADGDPLAVTQIDGVAILPGGSVAIGTGSIALQADGTLLFTPAPDIDGPVSFTYTLADGSGGTATGLVTGTVIPVNDAPVAADDAAATDQDTAVTGNVILGSGISGPAGRDTDVDGDVLTIVGVGAPAGGVGAAVAGSAGGTFTIRADGGFAFDPGADFVGLPAGASRATSVGYTVSDGAGGLATALLTVRVDGLNDAPDADAFAPLRNADGETVALAAGAAFRDADGDALAFAATGLPPGLAIDPATGAISGTVAPGASGAAGSATYRVTITATDPSGAAASRSVDWTIVNPAPVAADDAFAVAEDGVLTGSLAVDNGTGPDADPDGDALAYGLVTGPANGTIVLLPDGRFTYTPNPDFAGSDGFTYRVSDGNGGTSLAAVTITVAPVNDAPVALADAFAVAEDGIVSIPVLANDRDVDGDPLAIVAIDGRAVAPGSAVAVAGGTVTLNPDGTLTFAAAPDFAGPVQFAYTLSDGIAASVGQVTGIVTPVNDAPVNGLPPSFTGQEDAPLPLLGLSIADADAGPLTVTLTVDAGALAAIPAGGVTVVGSGTGALTLSGTRDALNAYLAASAPVFTPPANGTDPITLTMRTADDGAGGAGGPLADVDTATILIAPVNDAPTTQNLALTTTEEQPVAGAIVAADLDGDALTFALVAQPAGGTVRLDPDGTFIYKPNPDASGVETFQVRIDDGQGGTALATVTVTVQPLNDAPVAAPLAVATLEDAPVSGTLPPAFDAEGDAVAYALAAGPASGRATVTADGRFTYVPNPDFNGTDRFTYAVSDGTATSTYTVTVTVGPVNDAPVAAADVFATAEDAPATLAVLANDRDADGDPLTITAIDGQAVAPGGTVAASNGAVTLNPDGTLTFAPAPDASGAVAFTYTVSDGRGGTATATVTGTIAPVNDGPVAAADGFAAAEDTPATLAVLANDADVDGDPLTVTAIDGRVIGVGGSVAVAGGTVTLNADGTLTFTPVADFNGPVSFAYTVSDGQGGSATATVSGIVTPVQDAPVAIADAFTTAEDTPATVTVLANDRDADGDPLTITAIDGQAAAPGGTVAVASGAVTLNPDGTLTFAPAPDANGAVSFTYTVSDGRGGTATATVTGTVTPINDVPAPVADGFTTTEDTPVPVLVLANDADADADPLTLTAIDGQAIAAGASVAVAGGTVTLDADGTLLFAPAADFDGPVSFTYTVSDGQGGTATAAVTGTVTPVNDAPVATADAFTTAEDTLATVAVLANDRDADGDPLAVTAIDGVTIAPGGTVAVANGAVTLNADGTLTFAPAPNVNGAVSFTYTVSDGRGGSATATVAGIVTPVNDAPVLGDDAFTVPEDGAVTFDLRANDSDVDGDPLTVTAIDGRAIAAGGSVVVPGGTVTLNPDGTLTFVPATDVTGPVGFSATVSDGRGGSATATVAGTITPANDAPALGADRFTTLEEIPARIAVLANDRDADGDPLAITSVDGVGIAPGLTVAVANGAVTLNPDGTLTFAPAPDVNGAVSFTYTVSDGQGGSATATVTGIVTPVNDAPVPTADGFTTAEDTPVVIPVLANDADADGDPLTVVAIDGQAVTAGGSVAVAGGTITLDADGTLVFAPTADFNGSVSFAYTVSDGQGGTTSASVAGTVAPVDDAPVATADAFTTAEDTPAIVTVLGNDRDVDRDPLTVTAIDGQAVAPGLTVAVTNGAVTLNQDGTLTFVPAPNANGTVAFAYTVSDGQGGTATATVTGTITPVDDAPVPAADAFTTAEDTSVLVPVLANDADADGDPLTVTAIDGRAITSGGTVAVAGGTVTLNVDGTLVFAPAADVNGPVSFAYTVSDGRGGTATATVSGTVTPVDDAPVPGADTLAAIEDTPATLAVLANDRDAEGDPLAVTAIDGVAIAPGLTVAVAGGRVTLNPDGSLTFVPQPDFDGPVSFAYTVSDGRGGSATATVSGLVTPVNDAPLAGADAFTTAEDTPATLAVLANDRDADGDPLAVTAIDGQAVAPGGTVAVASGAVTLNLDGTLTFAPAADANGAVSFTYTVSDGRGGSATATVSGVVAPVNDAPVVAADALATSEDRPTVVAVLANDRDADGDPLAVTAVDGVGILPGGTVAVAGGAVTLNPDGTLTFVPNPDFNGPVSFTYTASDGQGGSATATVGGTVSPVDDVPTPAADRFVTAEDTSVRVPVLANDADPDSDSLTVTAIDGRAITAGGSVAVAGGTVTLNVDGTLTFVPAADFNGPVSFAYTASDGRGGSATTVVTGSVALVDDPPVAGTDTFVVAEDGAVTIAVLANDRDVEGDALSLTAVDGRPIAPGEAVAVAGGLVRLAAEGTLVFVPAPDVNGAVRFTYTVSDGRGGTATGTVLGTIAPVADAPIAADDTFASTGAPSVIPVLANDRDPDGDPLSLTAIDGRPVAPGGSVAVVGGQVTLLADGTLLFVPDPGFAGATAFTYTVSDGQGGSATAAVRGTVAPFQAGDNITRDRGEASRERLLFGAGWIVEDVPLLAAGPCPEVGSLRILPYVVEHARVHDGTGLRLADALPRHADPGVRDVLHEGRPFCTTLRITPEVVDPLRAWRLEAGPLPVLDLPSVPELPSVRDLRRPPEPVAPAPVRPVLPGPPPTPDAEPILIRKGEVPPSDWMFRDDPAPAGPGPAEAPGPGLAHKLRGFANRFEHGQARLHAAFAEPPPPSGAAGRR
ncbi:Ig-like domain-containing protein [Methylobacterium sp. 174MFSha1.1]|uniref:Ig-like domain-containing protein n=1 Tax=Methylobacterium sp. 174MFSha1.1 TaxID=1502749 RepID=UPI000ACD5AE5|nr:Ig-like domain-containing protein [Methylobacterium sp. 174MFSha1.1]